jgi:hypothetical protein
VACGKANVSTALVEERTGECRLAELAEKTLFYISANRRKRLFHNVHQQITNIVGQAFSLFLSFPQALPIGSVLVHKEPPH